MNMTTWMRAAALIGAMTALGGCVPAAVVGGGTLGVSVAEQRSTKDQLADAETKAAIGNRFITASTDLYRRVDVNVFEGRAMLTGTVLSHEERLQAEHIAATTAGVLEVLSEIEVNPEGGGVITYGGDVRIANEIRSRMLTDGSIKKQNYDVRVNHGVAYLIGIASSPEELAHANAVAGAVPGVKQVVSHLLLINDPRRKPPSA